jgi:hypothetical protein
MRYRCTCSFSLDVGGGDEGSFKVFLADGDPLDAR